MGSTRSSSQPAVSTGLDQVDDRFETLRQIFHARLQNERSHFASVNAALSRADEHTARIFEDLMSRAHRLQGGAAIFEESEIATAAGKLEKAAAAAVRSDGNGEGVRRTMEALGKLVSKIDAAGQRTG